MAGPSVQALWNGDLAAWRSNAAPDARATLAAAGSALCLDVTLGGPGSWAIARCEMPLTLPPHYVVVLDVHGDLAGIELQVKLVDASGANVWWWRVADFAASATPTRLVLRRASLAFAWGPRSGGDPDVLRAVEVAVAGTGVRGRLCIDALRIEPRVAHDAPPRAVAITASSSAAGADPAALCGATADPPWRPASVDAAPTLTVDLGDVREWGGLVVAYAGDIAPPCRLLGSDDGAQWRELVADPGGTDPHRWLRTGAVESRFIRLALPPNSAVAALTVVPIERAVSPARWAAARAAAAPRGHYPRHLLGEQAYWAVVGGDGAARKGLLSEDGALEIDAEAFTLEPFLRVDDCLITWADVTSHASLADDCLPVPSVTWDAGGLRLRITACSAGAPEAGLLVAQYTMVNAGAASCAVRLLVAVRPYQVTPAWQSLNLTGGVAPIARLAPDGASLHVDDARRVVAVTMPAAVGALRSDVGLAPVFAGALPPAGAVDDPLGFAEGVFAFDLTVAAGGEASAVLAVPLFSATPVPPAGLAAEEAAAWGAARIEETVAHWRARLAPLPIALPPAAAAFEQSLRASLAWILVNRDGVRIQPGSRTYRRSWIRDGALTGTALAELGFADELRAFLDWYAPFQLPDGRIPCAVDHRGVDPVVEHDSHGEFIWATVELWRLTGDAAHLRAAWPRVCRAVDAIAALRAARLTAAWRGSAAFGLLPESISHEGYSAQPVHAYWDDFFAVLGLASAAEAAAVLDLPEAARFAELHAAMRRDVVASVAHTIEAKQLDVLPGSVELGDFDPTSSAIAFDPCELAGALPADAVRHTFERYWAELTARRAGRGPNASYTPYEVRTATALLRLGWPERALEQLATLIADQRPRAWRQWPEIAWRDVRAPRFLGDLPHGWVASSFLRAVRRLLVDERGDGTLVLAAGVPVAWLADPGVRVRGLPTRHGRLDFTLRADGPDRVRATCGGTAHPPGGVVLVSPGGRPLVAVRVDGRAPALTDPHRVHLTALPATVELLY